EAAERQPAGMEDDEVAALLRIAKTRLDQASAAAHTGIQYEGAIWQQVLHRLDRRSRKPSQEPLVSADTESATNELASVLSEADFGEFEGVVRLRKQMGEQAAMLAAAHKDAVWQQVQSRIQARSSRRSLFRLLGRSPALMSQGAPDFYRRDAALF